MTLDMDLVWLLFVLGLCMLLLLWFPLQYDKTAFAACVLIC